MAELLRRGFDVYLTLVDDKQIDCIVRQEVNGKLVYQDIQIKARSRDAKPSYAGKFGPLEVREPRRNFFFIFYSEPADAYWVMSSLDLVREANQYKTGGSAGRYSIVFTNLSRKTGKVTPRPRFAKYKDDFDVLKLGRKAEI